MKKHFEDKHWGLDLVFLALVSFVLEEKITMNTSCKLWLAQK